MTPRAQSASAKITSNLEKNMMKFQKIETDSQATLEALLYEMIADSCADKPF